MIYLHINHSFEELLKTINEGYLDYVDDCLCIRFVNIIVVRHS